MEQWWDQRQPLFPENGSWYQQVLNECSSFRPDLNSQQTPTRPPIDTFVTATTPSYESEVVAMFNKYKPLDDVIRVGGLL